MLKPPALPEDTFTGNGVVHPHNGEGTINPLGLVFDKGIPMLLEDCGKGRWGLPYPSGGY